MVYIGNICEQDHVILCAKNFVRNLLGKECSGHDFWHALRVEKNALKIARKYDCDICVVRLAALLHDVDDPKLFEPNSKNIDIFLNSINLPIQKKDHIKSIIKNITYKKTFKASSVEETIVSDADKLDALGVIGIARLFAFGGANGKCMYNPSKDFKNNSSIEHFFNELIHFPESMETNYAKRLSKRKVRFMKRFIEEFIKESTTQN